VKQYSENGPSYQNETGDFEEGHLLLGRDLGLMGIDPAARRLLGAEKLSKEQGVFDRLATTPGWIETRSNLDRVLREGRPRVDCTGNIPAAGGRAVACRYSVHPVFAGAEQLIGVLLSLKKMPPKALVAPGARPSRPLAYLPRMGFGEIYEELPEAVFTVDRRRRITSFNRAAEAVTGYPKKAALGKPCWRVLRSDACRTACPLSEILRKGGMNHDQEVVITRSSGERCPGVVSTNALRDSQGGVSGAIQTFHPAAAQESIVPPVARQDGFWGMIGQSLPMRRLFSLLPDVARSDAAVLICGETGTGKDLLARAIHRLSGLRDAPFVTVNCSALAETLLESELFGHVKGAFTGAERDKPGRFELAGTGTLLLDEIGELKPSLQVKLLRVLEQRSYERVGGTRAQPFKARLISATNIDLKCALEEGRFREDLFFRLRTVSLRLPPLRERKEDIPALVRHFIRLFNRKHDKRVRDLDPKVMRSFLKYHWPGNVRELERCLEHAFVFVKGPVIFASHLPDFDEGPLAGRPLIPPVRSGGNPADPRNVLWALKVTGGRRKEAAALLGISRTSMWRRMKAMELL
jgi:PAS domain S-box-containing protein